MCVSAWLQSSQQTPYHRLEERCVFATTFPGSHFTRHFANAMCETEFTCNNRVHVKAIMTDYQDLLLTIKSLQYSRLSYIELLQEEVKRNQDRPSEKIKSEEDSDDSSRPATSAYHISAQTEQFTAPYSIPRTLTVSPSLGGQPLSPELVVSLRNILFGNSFHIFNYEWKKSFFKFREPFSDMAYALETERVVSARAVLCPQNAFTLRNCPRLPSKACKFTSSMTAGAYSAARHAASTLHAMAILQGQTLREMHKVSPDPVPMQELQRERDVVPSCHNTEQPVEMTGTLSWLLSTNLNDMVTVGEKEQRKVLAAALSDILCTAGEEQTATVCLVTSERCFIPHMDYKLDNFTERLQIFTFKKER
ncbi:uncharacterized protein LOC107704287 [Sinocyclocheilus anshuiensis]|uniref:uncharacterized protein LOC107704287 n=1 Tax=Sinocyclocheilus anshuiensis TaxID=1608454 RepID=UPI0007B8B9CB|nr:PREDICTED: uncharacterized protein LOC107704287 [Sinocyclocheilus anshuiensis]